MCGPKARLLVRLLISGCRLSLQLFVHSLYDPRLPGLVSAWRRSWHKKRARAPLVRTHDPRRRLPSPPPRLQGTLTPRLSWEEEVQRRFLVFKLDGQAALRLELHKGTLCFAPLAAGGKQEGGDQASGRAVCRIGGPQIAAGRRRRTRSSRSRRLHLPTPGAGGPAL
jgi:hypothetical protein